MPSRLELHEELCDILGSRNVYYQPPESVRLNYPCIVYKKSKPSEIKADNRRYITTSCYDITVITRDPDSDIADKIVDHFLYSSSEGTFVTQNLHHDQLKIYY